MATIPLPPADGVRTSALVSLRFEDVTQDGRLVLEALPNALGPTVWRGMLTRDPFARIWLESGIVPILTRFRLEGMPGPFSAHAQLEAQATSRIALAGAPPPDGRVVLDVWADLYAPIGRTYGATPRDGERALAGQVFAEHTFTRLLALPGQRRVTPLDVPGASAVRETRAASPAPESIASVPAGAVSLESTLRLDPVPIAFGLVHTDSNMHVNSLAYLRVFEEAALRRFAALGRGPALLGRQIDIVYRKPCFAGQTMRVALQAFEHEGKLGVCAVLVEHHEGTADQILAGTRPHTFAQMMFEP